MVYVKQCSLCTIKCVVLIMKSACIMECTLYTQPNALFNEIAVCTRDFTMCTVVQLHLGTFAGSHFCTSSSSFDVNVA